MQPAHLTLLLAFSAPSPDRAFEPREPHPPQCNLAAVRACVDEHRQAQLSAQASLEDTFKSEALLAPRLATARSVLDDATAKVGLLREELLLLSKEIAFANSTESSRAPEIFPEFPTVEKLFSVDSLDQEWLGRYPTERAGLLIARLENGKSEETALNKDLAEKSLQFQALSNQFTSLQQEEARLRQAESQHAAACSGGCRSAICPPREP